MMKKVFLALVILFLLNIALFAQEKGFYAFDVKGKVYAKDKGTEKLVVRKQSLTVTTALIVKENSSVVLFRESDGVPITLKTPGNYNNKKLMELADAAKPNVTGCFLDFCKTEILKDHDKGINKGTGVVSRGPGDFPMLLPPESSLIIDLSVTFCWIKNGTSKKTYFIITDSANNQLMKIITTDTSVTVFPYSSGLSEGRTYYWIVSDKINPNNEDVRYSFRLSSTEHNMEIIKKLDEFKRSLIFSEDVNMLMLARFYEENSLFREALETYRNAILKFPGNENITTYYNKFLKIKGL